MGCLETHIKDFFLHISATKVVASWTLFIGIFIMVLDVFFQDSNIPERQMLKKYQGQDTGGKRLTDPCQTASVRALYQTHGTVHEGGLHLRKMNCNVNDYINGLNSRVQI